MKTVGLASIMAIVGTLILVNLASAGQMRKMSTGKWDTCPCMRSITANLTPEKRALLDGILSDHRKDTQVLREQMWEKNTLLKSLSGNPKTQPEAIMTLVKEIGQINKQLESKNEDLRARVGKDVGVNLPASLDAMGGRWGIGSHRFGGQGPRGLGRGMSMGTANSGA